MRVVRYLLYFGFIVALSGVFQFGCSKKVSKSDLVRDNVLFDHSSNDDESSDDDESDDSASEDLPPCGSPAPNLTSLLGSIYKITDTSTDPQENGLIELESPSKRFRRVVDIHPNIVYHGRYRVCHDHIRLKQKFIRGCFSCTDSKKMSVSKFLSQTTAFAGSADFQGADVQTVSTFLQTDIGTSTLVDITVSVPSGFNEKTLIGQLFVIAGNLMPADENEVMALRHHIPIAWSTISGSSAVLRFAIADHLMGSVSQLSFEPVFNIYDKPNDIRFTSSFSISSATPSDYSSLTSGPLSPITVQKAQTTVISISI